ncbi:hypothetical protein [Verminephrobacter aporrectodeae]|uniref:hypothetical protein n=1 Tax=Verminephrobacter aporrectodeae TaxID=1110389 RepID=UPI00223732A8|nr:hypothetical protein [Verminephrobacter aporrectodeae]MCW8207479.1 hypothetical protein [Verminephrobacter aporrectodeae subsp. tuberculatae]
MDTDDDYPDAAKRHLHDAQWLLAQARLANASHLSGLSAECALKAIAKAKRFDGTKKVHIPGIFSELQNLSSVGAGNPDLVSKIAALQTKFADWNVNQRYAPQNKFTIARTSEECAGAHAACQLMTNYGEGVV